MFVISTAAILLAQAASSPTLQKPTEEKNSFATPKVASISLFKNGYAYVTREIAVKDGVANVVEIPQASLGTLWFWTEGGNLESITSDEQLNKKTDVVPIETIAQLLENNVGKSVVVEARNPNLTTITLEGKIISATGDLVIFDVKGEKMAITKGAIHTIRSSEPGFAVTISKISQSTQRYYRIKVSGKAKTVMMMSLEKGASWAPAYALDTTHPKKLTLVARATLLNDLTNFDAVPTRLITGFPNLQFKDILEPLTAQMTLDQWLGYLSMEPRPNGGGGGFGGGGRREMMTQNAYSVADAPAPDWSGVPTNGGNGEKIGDLFFYDFGALTLKKNARVMQTLFRTESPYEHIYCWDIDDEVTNNAEYRPADVNQPTKVEEVWHALKFKNTSGQPLTTGPASVYEKGQMIGQAQTSYVPRGADAELRITKALDIRPEQSEEEVTRERGAIKHPNGYPLFDLVTVKGTLVVKNQKSEPVKLVIKKNFTGEIIDAEKTPVITKTAKGLRDVNPKGKLTWTGSIPTGESITIKYTYKLYVRSQQ